MRNISLLLILICLTIHLFFSSCSIREPGPPDVQLPESTYTGAKITLWISANDPNKDRIYYIVNWGDGMIDTFPESGQTPYNSGYIVPVYHFYEKWSPPRIPEYKNFEIIATAKDEKGNISKYWSDPRTIKVIYNEPPNRPTIILPRGMGGMNTLQGFGATATDPEGDSISFHFGFSNTDQWTRFIASGDTIFPDKDSIAAFHSWTEPGIKGIWAIAKDKKGSISISSETLNFEVIDEGYVKGVFHAIFVVEGEAETLGFQSSPALVNIGGIDKIFIGSEAGYAYIVNTQTMSDEVRIFYYIEDPEDLYGWGNSPAVDFANGRWYMANDEGNFTSVNLWRYPNITGCEWNFTDAAFNGNYVYVATTDTLYCLNGSNGLKLWGYSISNIAIKTAPIIDVEGNVYIGDDSGYVRKINGITGQLIWQKDIGGWIPTSGAIGSDGTIYFCVNGTSANLLCALEPDSGGLRWFYSVGEKVTTLLAIDAQDYIYLGDTLGRIHSVKNGTSKPGFPITIYVQGQNAILSTPAFAADNYFYIMTEQQHVFCIGTDGRIRWVTPLPSSEITQMHGNKRENNLVPSPVIGADGDIYVAAGANHYGLYRIQGRTSGTPANTPWSMFRHDRNHSGKAGFVPSRSH